MAARTAQLRPAAAAAAAVVEATADFDARPDSERIVLNVGGTRFETTLQTIRQFPADSLVGRAFAPGGLTMRPDPDGSYFFDRDGRAFGIILQAARIGRDPPARPPDMSPAAWLAELDFWAMRGDELAMSDKALADSRRVLEARLRSKLAAQVSTMVAFFRLCLGDAHRTLRLAIPIGDFLPLELDDLLEPFIDYKAGGARPSLLPWEDLLKDREVRSMVRKSGISVRVLQPSVRYRRSKAAKYPFFGVMDRSARQAITVTVMTVRVAYALDGGGGGDDDDDDAPDEGPEPEACPAPAAAKRRHPTGRPAPAASGRKKQRAQHDDQDAAAAEQEGESSGGSAASSPGTEGTGVAATLPVHEPVVDLPVPLTYVPYDPHDQPRITG